MTAAALNRLDLFVVSGMPGVSIRAPWTLGADGCGVIDQVGSAVDGLRVGDRVVINPGISDRSCEYCKAGEQSLCVRFGLLGEHHPRTIAEYLVVPAANVRRIPPGVSDVDAAAFTLATLTAWRMVVTRAAVRRGEQVLIWGIGGGGAQAALRICLRRGASPRVTSSGDDTLARAPSLRAVQTGNHRGGDGGRRARGRTGQRGADVGSDPGGGAAWP